MGIYLGANALGGGGGAGGSLLTDTSTYRALLIGGGGNGFYGVTYGAGGSGAGGFFETTLSFYNDISYAVTVGAGGGTTSFETAIGKFSAPTGGQGRRVANGTNGASGGGGNSSNTTFRVGGMPNMYNAKGEYLGSPATVSRNGSTNSPDYYYYSHQWMKDPGLQTMGHPGGYANSSYGSGGGGGAGGAGQSGVSNGAGGNGRTSDIITTANATSASVGQVDGGEVWFGAGGYGGRLSSINTTKIGRGPGTGGGGQSSSVNPSGVSSGDSGCVILKVPTSTDFTQTGANTYTDQGMTCIVWTGAGTFQLNS